ncbi:hypothetical protein PWT90_06155 [Aphanocladium album]|nr:hypothetical protein PWT90_06155 [Aphanocladium album]
MAVPKRQVVNQTRKQARLKRAEEEPHGRDTGKAVRRAQAHCHDAPAKHEKREPAAGLELLEEDVARHLEDGVRYEEHHQRNDELVVGHARRLLHVVVRRRVENFGVANVGTVKEAQKIDASAEGYDLHVLAPDQTLLLGAERLVGFEAAIAGLLFGWRGSVTTSLMGEGKERNVEKRSWG